MTNFAIKRHPIFEYAALAAATSLYLLLFGPISIYINNYDSFTVNIFNLSEYLFTTAAIACLGLLVLFIGLPAKLSNAVIRILAATILLAWLYSSFLYGDYGRLDGNELTIDPWGILLYAQVVVLVIVIITITTVKIEHAKLTIFFVFLIGLISTSIGITNIDFIDRLDRESGFHNGMTEMSPTKNILHVVLDALQSDLMLAAIETYPSLKKELDGFTFYKNTLSVYPTTEMSIPMMISGRIYRNNIPKKDFINELIKQHGGIIKLQIKGYEIDSHTICSGLIQNCTSISPGVLSDESQSSEALKLLDIYLFKSSPEILKSYIYNHGNWFLLAQSNANAYLKVPLVGLGHLLFKKFINELTVSESASPRYKLFHSIITHDPVRLNEKCEIVVKEDLPLLSRVDFVSCGIQHFIDLIKKLKVMGIYDNTMIILSSDHGARYLDEKFIKSFSSIGISREVVGLASASLLVKPFMTRGKLKYSNSPTSLRDIPLTILSATGLGSVYEDSDTFPAQNILDMPSSSEYRVREFLYYKWEHKYWKEEGLPPIKKYAVKGDLKDPSSWPYSININGTLQCNQKVPFNTTNPGIQIVYGFSHIEKWGRWTNAVEAEILFNIDTKNCKNNTLSIRLRGFTPEKHPLQHVTVTLNNSEIGQTTIIKGDPNPQVVSFAIMQNLIKGDSVNSLKFYIQNPVSPKSVGVNNDTRLLGIGFESMLFQ